MDHCGTETLQPTSQFKMADRLTQSLLGVAQHCSALGFPLQKFRNFILRNKALVYLLKNKYVALHRRMNESRLFIHFLEM